MFGVGRTPAGASPGATERTQGNGGLDVARWLLLLGALAAGGLSGVRFALTPVRSDRNLRTVPGAARLRLAALLVVAGGAVLALLTLPDALSTRFGIVAAGSGALALVAAGSAATGAGVLADAAAIALVAGPPLAGHALSPGRLDAIVLPVDVIHTAAAAAWLGGLLWLVLLASAALRAGGAALGPSAREFCAARPGRGGGARGERRRARRAGAARAGRDRHDRLRPAAARQDRDLRRPARARALEPHAAAAAPGRRGGGRRDAPAAPDDAGGGAAAGRHRRRRGAPGQHDPAALGGGPGAGAAGGGHRHDGLRARGGRAGDRYRGPPRRR